MKEEMHNVLPKGLNCTLGLSKIQNWRQNIGTCPLGALKTP